MSRSKKPKNVYAFIDSQNLNLGVQRVGWKMDWRKFRQYLHDVHGVTQAYMFIGYMHENEAMYNQLHELGYLIVLKPTIEMNIPPAPKAANVAEQVTTKDIRAGRVAGAEQATGADSGRAKQSAKTEEPAKPIIKGNIDAELVLYAMMQLPNYDKAIIVSGDGDFYCLAEYLAKQGKLAHILTPNYKYSSLLKPYEGYIIRIDQLKGRLEHKDYRKRLRKPKV